VRGVRDDELAAPRSLVKWDRYAIILQRQVGVARKLLII
jgi:hypothetical protein